MTKENRAYVEQKAEVCKSVFKNGVLTREEYTHKWLELISALETSKSVKHSPSR